MCPGRLLFEYALVRVNKDKFTDRGENKGASLISACQDHRPNCIFLVRITSFGILVALHSSEP